MQYLVAFTLYGGCMEEQDRLKWIYSSKDNQELSERYSQWANDYDTELIQDYGWRAPQTVTDFVEKYVPKDSKILDAGAGTGLVGQCLNEQGYKDLAAIDLSEAMLEKAREKKVYRELHQMVLGEALDLPNGAFDAVVCVGVFTYGHAPARSLEELVRVTRPKGYIIFVQRPEVHQTLGFKEKQAELESAGRWELVEISDSHLAFGKKESDAPHQVWVYQVV
jgi:predicted TPR repeat methyltransferase